MKGYVCYKNGKVKNLKNKKIKTSKAEFVLLELSSGLYGTAYIKFSMETYKRIKNMFDIKLSYKFFDGANVDDDEIDKDEISITHKYYYKDASQLFSKISDIAISEIILNDTFWVHDCYYGYYFYDYVIKYCTKNARYKFTQLENFHKSIKDNNHEGYTRFVTFNGSKYKSTDDVSKAKNGDRIFLYLTYGIYIETTKEFFNVKHLVTRTKLNVYEYDDGNKTSDKSKMSLCYTETKFDNDYDFSKKNKKRTTDMTNLVISRFGQDVVNQLESNNEYMCFRIIERIKKIGNKKKNIRIDKFVHKYFPSIPYDKYDII